MGTADQETHGFPQVLRNSEVPLGPLVNRTVAVIGYGNQGRAHALNLRDSGVRVVVGGRSESHSVRNAATEGFDARPTRDAVHGADLVILAIPDEHHAHVWARDIAPAIRIGQTVGFLHGLSVHAGWVAPPAGIGCIMVAPKGPGATLRARFERGEGIPALVAVKQDAEGVSGRELALAWAAGIGSGRAGVILTSFKDEAETDLFGEQAVLCGGMLALARAGFQTLVDAGYPPVLAYIECVHEIKQVADLLYERGPKGMRAAISNAAEFGAFTAEPRIADEHLKSRMRDLLRDVQSGAFTKRMAEDTAAGNAWLNAQRTAADADRMEQAGAEVRALMPWLKGAAPQ